ncbi:MAG: hypothetical protein P8Y60_08370 [Calditrichota bacterium]
MNKSIIIKHCSSTIIAFLIIFLMLSCNKNSTEPEKFNFPDSNLSFSRDIYPIFRENCISSGCHESVNPAAGLDLETMAPTFNSVDGPVVYPFDAEHSILYLLLNGEYNGISRMPLSRGPLAPEKIQAIKTWINEGALINN